MKRAQRILDVAVDAATCGAFCFLAAGGHGWLVFNVSVAVVFFLSGYDNLRKL